MENYIAKLFKEEYSGELTKLRSRTTLLVGEIKGGDFCCGLEWERPQRIVQIGGKMALVFSYGEKYASLALVGGRVWEVDMQDKVLKPMDDEAGVVTPFNRIVNLNGESVSRTMRITAGITAGLASELEALTEMVDSGWVSTKRA